MGSPVRTANGFLIIFVAMLKSILIILFVFCGFSLFSQEPQKVENENGEEGFIDPRNRTFQAEPVVDKGFGGEKIFSFKINPYNLDTFKVTFDTVYDDFYNYNPIYRKSIANAYLGNLGSPYQSMLFFDRPVEVPFVFMDVYREYIKLPEDYRFYNTRTPYTSLNYWNGGPKRFGEEQIKVVHSRNIGKDFNITAYADYIYGRGLYDRLSTKHLNFALISSYVKPRYSLFTVAGINNLENFENGGFASDLWVTNPISLTNDARSAREYNTYEVNLNDSRASFKNRFLSLNQEYRIGFRKDVELEDTVIKEFVAVNSIGHEFIYSQYSKNYYEDAPDRIFYRNTLINTSDLRPGTLDSTYRRVISNTVKLYFEEGLNKYVPFGFGVYLKNELIKQRNNAWSMIPDSVFNVDYSTAKMQFSGLIADSSRFTYMQQYGDTLYTNTSVGGHIFRRRGKNYFFDAGAELFFLGYRQGDYRITGQFTKWFAFADSVSLTAKADFSRTTPDYFLNHYRSNHFWWDNNFDATFEQRIEGALEIPTWNMLISLKLNTIVNHIYFDSLAMPQQYSSALPLLELSAKKDFRFGKFHWDNQVAYQVSGNRDVLPLPELAARSALYYRNKFFNVLSVMVGVDGIYHTSYNMPAYMPATGRFYNQSDTEYGNYPLLNAFGNFQIKRMRFFVMFYHVNHNLFPSPNHFSAAHYAHNPRLFKVGVSWNFYD
jgi:hypothetical protein